MFFSVSFSFYSENFSSLDSNRLKLTPAHLTQHTLLVLLASFLMNIAAVNMLIY